MSQIPCKTGRNPCDSGLLLTGNREYFEVPNKNGNVWPENLCPAYTPREEAIKSLKGCWYCRYADFHLTEERALEVGICKWPHRII